MKLVNDFQPVLQAWGMHGEGQAMWMLFRDQITEHARMRVALEEAAFRGITQYFHRAWRHPMRFEGAQPS